LWNGRRRKKSRAWPFKLSTDPLFVEKVRDIVGLYLAPPERAVVLCVDEKSQIQALDRSQPLLPMRPAKVERRSHDYTRHGMLSLFAALDTAKGKVVGRCFARHRAREFRAFLNTIEAHVPPDLDVHVIMDNVPSHKTRQSVTVHYSPTSASRISQVERFLANLPDKQIRLSIHRSTDELETAIKTYIEAVNASPKHFVWTKSADDILASVKRFCLATLKTAEIQIAQTSESGH
jgi:transposase